MIICLVIKIISFYRRNCVKFERRIHRKGSILLLTWRSHKEHIWVLGYEPQLLFKCHYIIWHGDNWTMWSCSITSIINHRIVRVQDYSFNLVGAIKGIQEDFHSTTSHRLISTTTSSIKLTSWYGLALLTWTISFCTTFR